MKFKVYIDLPTIENRNVYNEEGITIGKVLSMTGNELELEVTDIDTLNKLKNPVSMSSVGFKEHYKEKFKDQIEDNSGELEIKLEHLDTLQFYKILNIADRYQLPTERCLSLTEKSKIEEFYQSIGFYNVYALDNGSVDAIYGDIQYRGLREIRVTDTDIRDIGITFIYQYSEAVK